MRHDKADPVVLTVHRTIISDLERERANGAERHARSRDEMAATIPDLNSEWCPVSRIDDECVRG
jgi:hypothetical protein